MYSMCVYIHMIVCIHVCVLCVYRQHVHIYIYTCIYIRIRRTSRLQPLNYNHCNCNHSTSGFPPSARPRARGAISTWFLLVCVLFVCYVFLCLDIIVGGHQHVAVAQEHNVLRHVGHALRVCPPRLVGLLLYCCYVFVCYCV